MRDLAHSPTRDAAKTSPPIRLYLVDGYNYLHAILLRGRKREGFWRLPFQQELLLHLGRATAPLLVALDASTPTELSQLSSELQAGQALAPHLFAPNADLELLRWIDGEARRKELCLVTADRSLADRARFRGAQVLSPFRFAETFLPAPESEKPADSDPTGTPVAHP